MPDAKNDNPSVEDCSTWSKLAPWDVFRSDLVIRTHHVLTEPVCPEAWIEFELPKRAGRRTVSHSTGSTLEEAIGRAIQEAVNKLPQMTQQRLLELESRGRNRSSGTIPKKDPPEMQSFISHTGHAIEIDWLDGNSPVEGAGRYHDAPFLFIATGNSWKVCVGAPGGSKDVLSATVWSCEEPYGINIVDAGRMSHEEASRHIRDAGNRYLARRFEDLS